MLPILPFLVCRTAPNLGHRPLFRPLWLPSIHFLVSSMAAGCPKGNESRIESILGPRCGSPMKWELKAVSSTGTPRLRELWCFVRAKDTPHAEETPFARAKSRFSQEKSVANSSTTLRNRSSVPIIEPHTGSGPMIKVSELDSPHVNDYRLLPGKL